MDPSNDLKHGEKESLAPAAMDSVVRPQPPKRTADLLPWAMSLAALVVVGAVVLVYDARNPPRALQANLDRALAAASMGPGAGYTQVDDAVGRFVEPDAPRPLDLAAFASATDDVERVTVACLGQDPKPEAVRIEINIEPSGLISAVTLEQPEVASDAARDCVAQAYADVRIASFDGPSEVIHKSFAVR